LQQEAGLIMSLTIYHHPQCSKSLKTLEIIREHGIEPEIIEYLQTPPDAQTTLHIAGLLQLPVAQMLRTAEPEYVAAKDTLPLDDDQALAEWLAANPRALQRPIVVDTDAERAIVGRPPENVLELLPQ
jgi:arsenate reductase